MQKRDLFIVVEGIDGSGKSSLSRRIADFFRKRGRNVVESREPTDEPFGRKIREAASQGKLDGVDELRLFVSDRRQHCEEVIKPTLRAGKVMVLDRYFYSNIAYQGARKQVSLDLIWQLNDFAPRPDIVLILDLPVEKAMERIGIRGEGETEFEKSTMLAMVRAIYLREILPLEPKAVLVDADRDAEAVYQDAIRLIKERLNLK